MNPTDKEDLKSMMANSLLEIDVSLEMIADCLGQIVDDIKEINIQLENQ